MNRKITYNHMKIQSLSSKRVKFFFSGFRVKSRKKTHPSSPQVPTQGPRQNLIVTQSLVPCTSYTISYLHMPLSCRYTNNTSPRCSTLPNCSPESRNSQSTTVAICYKPKGICCRHFTLGYTFHPRIEETQTPLCKYHHQQPWREQ